jgi:hypothetical protein
MHRADIAQHVPDILGTRRERDLLADGSHSSVSSADESLVAV